MIDFPPQTHLVLNSRLKLQIFEKEVPKRKSQGCPMTHMLRNEGEFSHQTALEGKRGGIPHFPSKLLEQIRNEIRIKKHIISYHIISYHQLFKHGSPFN